MSSCCHFGVWIIWMFFHAFLPRDQRPWAVPPFPSSEVPRAALRADLAVLYNATRIQNIAGHVVGNPTSLLSVTVCDLLAAILTLPLWLVISWSREGKYQI